jgi:hypothetical protein
VGKSVFGYAATPYTSNLATLSSVRLTSITSPCTNAPIWKNTAGPDFESTCPMTTALPLSPGVGPASYQPASSARSSGGVCTSPFSFVPRFMISAFTLILGMLISRGFDLFMVTGIGWRGLTGVCPSAGGAAGRGQTGAAAGAGRGGRISALVVVSVATIMPAPATASRATRRTPAARHGDL